MTAAAGLYNFIIQYIPLKVEILAVVSDKRSCASDCTQAQAGHRANSIRL